MSKTLILSGILIFFIGLPALASASFPEPYAADSDIPPGTVVSLVDGDEEKVERANYDNRARLFGVVVLDTEGAFLVDPGEDKVLVSSVGPIDVFVTDVNGPIRIGDPLTISPIEGIAMVSTKDEPTVGTALQSFDADSPTLGTKEVQTSDGIALNANFGKIRIQVRPDQGNNSIVPPFLAQLGENIAGKPVSSLRLFTSLAVMAVTLTATSGLLYGTVKTAITSIGRNPLSKASVYKGLFQVIGIVLIVFIAGTAGAYVILTV